MLIVIVTKGDEETEKKGIEKNGKEKWKVKVKALERV